MTLSRAQVILGAISIASFLVAAYLLGAATGGPGILPIPDAPAIPALHVEDVPTSGPSAPIPA